MDETLNRIADAKDIDELNEIAKELLEDGSAKYFYGAYSMALLHKRSDLRSRALEEKIKKQDKQIEKVCQALETTRQALKNLVSVEASKPRIDALALDLNGYINEIEEAGK